MKKRYIIAAVILALCFALAACECKHEWKDATCDAPQICAKCEETQGTPLSHEWKDATCEDPKTCSLCGDTQGEPMGHVWSEISCAAPVTCFDCGKTRGEALPHTWVEATCTTAKTCEVCGGTEGEPLGHTLGEYAWKVNSRSLDFQKYRTCSVCDERVVDTEGQLTALHENGVFVIGYFGFYERVHLLTSETEIAQNYKFYYYLPMRDSDGDLYGALSYYVGDISCAYQNLYMVVKFVNDSEMLSQGGDFDAIYFMCDTSPVGISAYGIIAQAVDPTFTQEESIRFMDDLLNSDDGVEEHNGLKYYVEKKGAQYHVLVSIVE